MDETDSHLIERERMVAVQLQRRGIHDPAVLAAMAAVPRHLFVPSSSRRDAYADRALSIGHGQTISQPYMVALMTQLLRLAPSSKVLEVGTGSGYQACVAARIAREVWSLERVAPLALQAAELMERLGVANVHVLCGDGCRGLAAQAPFDAVIVTAAAETVPMKLLAQLEVGGRLAMPLGAPGRTQILTVFTRRGARFERWEDAACRFVPLLEGPEGAPQPPGCRNDSAGSPQM